MEQGRVSSEAARNGLGLARLALVAIPIVFVAYVLALGIGHGGTLWDAVPGSVANTVPTMLFGLLAYALIRTWLVKQRPAVQLAGHLVIGGAYTLLSYWLLIVMLGAVSGISVIKFNVEPFPVRASVWQMLENATVYGIIAALAYRGTGAGEVTVVLADGEEDESRAGFTRYFIRSGDEIQ